MDKVLTIRAESTSAACSACGEKQEQGAVAVLIGEVTTVLCQACGNYTATAIQDKLSLRGSSVPLSREEMTSEQVTAFATCPRDVLLDELVMCTARWIIGPLDADECQIATALLERLATLGIARKSHRAGCEVWPKYRLCSCPWEVPS